MAYNNAINNKIGITSPNGYTFPLADATAAYQCMQSNAAGSASWSPVVITPWISFTTTITATTTNPTLGTHSTYSFYMQIGKTLFISYVLSMTSAGTTAGNGNYLFNLPPGFVLSTLYTFPSTSSNVGSVLGSAHCDRSGVANGNGCCQAYDTTHYNICVASQGQQNTYPISSNYFNTTPGSTQTYSANLIIPLA